MPSNLWSEVVDDEETCMSLVQKRPQSEYHLVSAVVSLCAGLAGGGFCGVSWMHGGTVAGLHYSCPPSFTRLSRAPSIHSGYPSQLLFHVGA